MATPRFAGSYSGFVPAATGLIVGYVRDPKNFKVNEYVQYLKTDKRVALYAVIERDNQARYVSDADSVWADGADSPSGNANLMRWQLVEFRTTRRAYPFQLGEMAIEQAKGTWEPLKVHTAMAAQQAMTARTKRVIDLLEDTNTWGTHAASANDLNNGAGTWDLASSDENSPNYNAIRRSLLEAFRRINLATNSIVQQDDLVLVISPGLALKMASTGEIHNYLRNNEKSDERMMGVGPTNSTWGLPDRYAGFKIVVEDASYVSSRPLASGVEATGTRSYCKSDTSALLISRKGGLDGGMAGSPSWSTVQIYSYKEIMEVEAFSDPKNRRVDGRVVTDFKEIVPSSYSGFLIQGTLPS